MAEKIYIVDGSSYIFRAFYAIAPLSTRAGLPTNALFGFARMLLKLLKSAGNDPVVVTFDTGAPTFRDDLYAEYKANRAACPVELQQQMPYFSELTAALGLPVLMLPGFEADDVIATLAERFSSAGHSSVIVSSDKDLLQLVGGPITVWDTMKDQRYGPAEVEAKLGVPPERVVDFLALTGDSSDNVPGLEGVGPKTAVQLIKSYGSVEQILASAEQIKNDSAIRGRQKIGAAIEQGAEVVRLSRKLVEIDRHAPVELRCGGQPCKLAEIDDQMLLGGILRGEPNSAELQRLTDLLEFKDLFSVLGTIAHEPAAVEAAKSSAYKTVWADDFTAFVERLRGVPEFAFDAETTSLRTADAEIVGVSFAWDLDEAFYVPIGHQGVFGAERQITWERFCKELRPLFESAQVRKIGHNLKYDLGAFAANGIKVAGVSFDTLLAAWVLDPDSHRYALADLAKELLGLSSQAFEDLVKPGETFAIVPIDLATNYSAEDALYSWRLQRLLRERLEREDLLTVLTDLELPLVPVLAEMELAGVAVDAPLLAAISKEFAVELDKLQGELHTLAGGPFNVNSPKQLAEVLFERLKIPTTGLKRTKTGISTDSSVLEKLSEQHELPALILRYRLLSKLKSTYVDVLPALCSPRTGRLHTHLNQTGTGTGRLSSSDPNLQNIPIQSPEGRRIRSAFIAAPGRVLLSADYSQIELRVLAHMSADPGLAEAFSSGQDIHSKTACELLGVTDPQSLTSEQRRLGKTINFGIVYGMSGFRLGRELGIPVSVANRYIEDYFKRYAGVQRYFAEVAKQAETEGFVTTLFGRKRRIAQIDSSGRDRGFLERVAINAPIQGTAADIMKVAMIKLRLRIQRDHLPLLLLLQIHDELLFECPADYIEQGQEIIRHELESAVKLTVPLKVEIGSGLNWEQAH